MFCTRCGFELREADRFCSRCGNRTELAQSAESHPLLLDKRKGKVAGVCAGLARYLGVDVVLIRVLTLIAALCTGVGFVAYIVAWVVIPSDHGFIPQQIHPSKSPSTLSYNNS